MYYFPYVYAKKEERIALCTSISPEKTIPIIHGQEGDIPKLCKELVEKNARFVVVTENFAAIKELEIAVNNSNFRNQCIIGLKTSLFGYGLPHDMGSEYKMAVIHDVMFNSSPEVLDFAEMHIFMPSISKSIPYLAKFPKEKTVIIEDAFLKAPRNADYTTENVYASHVFVCKTNKHSGFGDAITESVTHTLIGQPNMNTITAALHLTYKKDNTIFVRHYITSPVEEPDNSERIAMTMQKALDDASFFLQTSGMNLLKEKVKSSTNLGMLKRISFMHHLDLIQRLLNG